MENVHISTDNLLLGKKRKPRRLSACINQFPETAVVTKSMTRRTRRLSADFAFVDGRAISRRKNTCRGPSSSKGENGRSSIKKPTKKACVTDSLIQFRQNHGVYCR